MQQQVESKNKLAYIANIHIYYNKLANIQMDNQDSGNGSSPNNNNMEGASENVAQPAILNPGVMVDSN